MGIRRHLLLLLSFLLTVLSGCSHGEGDSQKRVSAEDSAQGTIASERSESAPADTLPPGVSALLESYPRSIRGYEDGYLIMFSGEKILYDDGREKSFTEMLDESDPQDQFFVVYDSDRLPPEYLSDAGRSRCERLFKSMYGNSEEAVRKHLIEVDWFGSKVPFTEVNGAAEALSMVEADIKASGRMFTGDLLKSSGTFYWRKVRGANRQSAHSYGIAIDIGVPQSDYWLWKNPGASETDRISYANRMPAELVKIFERHGFIWGGAWYHYDTMHFEYRPEIIAFAKKSRSDM